MNIQAQIDKAKRVIEKLEAELAEAEKPKLRHGDYGPATGSECRLVLKEYGKDELRTAGPACCAATGEDQMPETVLGNIFADLKARQEALKQFEIGNGSFRTVQVALEVSGLLKLRDKDGCVVIKGTEIPRLILNLQRLVYTAEASK